MKPSYQKIYGQVRKEVQSRNGVDTTIADRVKRSKEQAERFNKNKSVFGSIAAIKTTNNNVINHNVRVVGNLMERNLNRSK